MCHTYLKQLSILEVILQLFFQRVERVVKQDMVGQGGKD